jgi:hypothetical protein
MGGNWAASSIIAYFTQRLARLGPAYLVTAWPGSRPEAGPGTSLYLHSSQRPQQLLHRPQRCLKKRLQLVQHPPAGGPPLAGGAGGADGLGGG